MYQGEDVWNPPSGDGRIRSDFARIPVQLQAGVNRVVAEITATEPYGWGLRLCAAPRS
ncbi:MAG TPA: hypothetical protein VFK80_10400 [Limnochordia bacterium]|nr:hypothetical protein [Limnochordia bacterium]